MSTIAGAAARAAPIGKKPPFCFDVLLLLPLPNIKRFLLSTYGRLIPLPNSRGNVIFVGCRRRLCHRRRRRLFTYILIDCLLLKH